MDLHWAHSDHRPAQISFFIVPINRACLQVSKAVLIVKNDQKIKVLNDLSFTW